MDDGIRMGLISEDDIPDDIQRVLGKTSKERLNSMIRDMINTSRGKNDIMMSDEVNEMFVKLRKFMFERLYFTEEMLKKDEKIEKMLTVIYENEKLKNRSDDEILRFMSGMSDSYASAREAAPALRVPGYSRQARADFRHRRPDGCAHRERRYPARPPRG